MNEALENLLNLEKQHRFAEEISGTKACCSAILDVCFEARDWRLLNEQVVLLSKRRGQLKQVWCNRLAQCLLRSKHNCVVNYWGVCFILRREQLDSELLDLLFMIGRAKLCEAEYWVFR